MFLLFGAEIEERVTRQAVHAGRHSHCRPPRREFLQHLEVDLVRLASAIPLDRIRQPEESRLPELGEEPVGIRLGLLVRVGDRRQTLVGDIAGQGDQVARLIIGEQTINSHVASLSGL